MNTKPENQAAAPKESGVDQAVAEVYESSAPPAVDNKTDGFEQKTQAIKKTENSVLSNLNAAVTSRINAIKDDIARGAKQVGTKETGAAGVEPGNKGADTSTGVMNPGAGIKSSSRTARGSAGFSSRSQVASRIEAGGAASAATGAAGGASSAGAAVGAAGGVRAGSAAGISAPGATSNSKNQAPARRVKLTLTRVEPWSVMKFSFLVAVAFGVASVVAAALLWNIVDSIGLWDQITAIGTSLNNDQPMPFMEYFEFSKMMSYVVVVSVVNVIVITALGTMLAFLYNIVAALLGGLKFTFTDR